MHSSSPHYCRRRQCHPRAQEAWAEALAFNPMHFVVASYTCAGRWKELYPLSLPLLLENMCLFVAVARRQPLCCRGCCIRNASQMAVTIFPTRPHGRRKTCSVSDDWFSSHQKETPWYGPNCTREATAETTFTWCRWSDHNCDTCIGRQDNYQESKSLTGLYHFA